MSMHHEFFGVRVHPLSREEIMARLARYAAEPRFHLVATVGPEFVLRALRDDQFKNILSRADLNTVDGAGLRWAAYFSSQKFSSLVAMGWGLLTSSVGFFFDSARYRERIPEQVTGVEVLDESIAFAARKNLPVFLLGGKRGAAERAAEKFRKLYPLLSIQGQSDFFFHLSEFGDPWYEQRNDEVIREIVAFRTAILFLGFTSPKQEYWLFENRHRLEGVRVGVGVGMAIEYAAGYYRRAPRFFRTTMNLEWLWRLAVQPKRFLRIWRATAVFAWKVVQEKKRELI